ncbi:Histidine triad, conserved site-containing protein [Artemisia annua]|uniref:Bis(5'-adenosyl)-triphosphatase n=1 Tax=Artemisia annua TaxID=35608 RepID=A0A2U1MCH3_ARTAN|nr:Histidine triad, conserved site-containing protein [Artemisia annua]
MKMLQQLVPSLLQPFCSLRSPTLLRPTFHITRSSFSSSSTKMEGGGYKFGPYKIDEKEVFYSTHLSYALVNLRPLLPVSAGLINGFGPSFHFGPSSSSYWLLITLFAFRLLNLFAILDKRPHVLVCPRREVKRFVDLTPEETSDLWISAQKIGKQLENYHKASSLTLAIQDGPQAGQTVPHVHIHIVPRKGGDFENNDEIYDASISYRQPFGLMGVKDLKGARQLVVVGYWDQVLTRISVQVSVVQLDEKEKELKKTLDLDKERKDRSMEEMAREADEYRKLFS